MRTALVSHPIDVAALLAEVGSRECGAATIFVGMVRDVNEGRQVSGIEYSAYARMADVEMERIAAEAVERFGTSHVVVEHRIGVLSLGEASVVIAVAHPRRAPALDASRYIIEELKKRVPVWKLEHYVDGTREWVDPTGAGQPTFPGTT